MAPQNSAAPPDWAQGATLGAPVAPAQTADSQNTDAASNPANFYGVPASPVAAPAVTPAPAKAAPAWASEATLGAPVQSLEQKEQQYGVIAAPTSAPGPLGDIEPGLAIRNKIRDAENLTQQGRAEHPVEAAIGDFLNRFYTPQPEQPTNKPLTQPIAPYGFSGAASNAAKFAETMPEEMASAANPIEQGAASAASKIAAKAAVPVGTPATVAPSAEAIQPTLQQGIRNTVNKAATDKGFQAIPDSVSVRDVPKALGDQAYARSKATFDAAEKATGIDFTALKNNIFRIDDQISNVAITNPEQAGQLAQQKAAYEAQAEQGMAAAQAKGIDVTQARSDWNTQLRANELSNHVRNSAEGTLANPVINPTKLTPRLQKMNDAEVGQTAGKLPQLLGDDNAAALIQHSENARDAASGIKDFAAVPATDQAALRELIAPNTKAGMFGGTNVNWGKTLDDFDSLSTAEQRARFTDPMAVRSALRSKATWDAVMKAAKGIGGLGTTAEVLHLLYQHMW